MITQNDAEQHLKLMLERQALKDAETRERYARGEPNIDRAVACLWGAISKDGTLGRYPDLRTIELRILSALEALHAWPKDTRRFGGDK